MTGIISIKELRPELQKQINDSSVLSQALEQQIKIKKNVIVLSSGWYLMADGVLYEYKMVNMDINDTCIVDVNIHLSDLPKAKDVLPITQSNANNYVSLYATKKPTENILCDVKIVKEVTVNG